MICAREVAELLGVSRQWVYRLLASRDKNGFPLPCFDEPLRWMEMDIEHWASTYVPDVGGRPRRVA